MSSSLLSSACLLKVISCWEQSRQQGELDEIIGIDVMLALFETNHQAKVHFGFRSDQVISTSNGLQRIGILIHGQRFIHMLNSIFSMMGPDEDSITDILLDFNKDSCQEGMCLHQFVLLLNPLVKVMKGIRGKDKKDDWTDDLESSWHHVMRYLQTIIGKMAPKSITTKVKTLKSPIPSAHERSARTIVNI